MSTQMIGPVSKRGDKAFGLAPLQQVSKDEKYQTALEMARETTRKLGGNPDRPGGLLNLPKSEPSPKAPSPAKGLRLVSSQKTAEPTVPKIKAPKYLRHLRVVKSFIPGQGWIPATKAGKYRLKEAKDVRQYMSLAERTRAQRALPLHQRGRDPQENFHNNYLAAMNKEKLTPSSRKNVLFGPSVKPEHHEKILAALPKKVRRPVAFHHDESITSSGVQAQTISRAGPGRPAHIDYSEAAGPHTLHHEYEHAKPRRSYDRLRRVVSDPRKLGREEARADVGANARHVLPPNVMSGYESQVAAHRITRGNKLAGQAFQASGTNKTQVRGYRDMRAQLKDPVKPYTGPLGVFAAHEPKKRMKFAKVDRVDKANQDRGGTAMGAGTVVGTAGLLGGGVPGARPNSGRLAQVNRRGGRVEVTRHLVSASRGGVFGYREDAHRRFLNAQNVDEAAHGGQPTSRVNHFLRGRGTGKIQPEEQVIRHMKAGRVGSNVAAGAGAALLATGIHQHRKSQASKRDDSRPNAVIAGGATTAALAGGGSLVLDHQGRKWSARSAASMDEAQRLNHKLGGYTVKRTRTRVPDVVPDRSTERNVADQKRVFAGRSSKSTEAAGRMRGAAAQQRYFARVYGKIGSTSRKVGAAGALVAAAGLGASNHSIDKVDLTMSDADAKRLSAHYDTRGPLPKKLSRESRMKAYEARYIASGGRQGEKWKRRANMAETSRNIGLAGATAGAALTLAGRSKKLAPHLKRVKVTHHRADNAALGAAAFGGASELYGEHARARRASYQNSPAGVAGSALSRMQAYTPEKKKP